MHRVKGTKISAKLAYVRERWGEERLQEVLESLSAEDRHTIRAAVDAGWYSSDVYDRLLDGVLGRAEESDEVLLEEMGRQGAEALSTGSYRVYYRSGDAPTVLRKMIPMHEALNDPGRMEVVEDGPTRLRVVVHEPRSTGRVCRVAEAFYRRSVELCGVSDVRVEETSCSSRGAEGCEFSVRWTE